MLLYARSAAATATLNAEGAFTFELLAWATIVSMTTLERYHCIQMTIVGGSIFSWDGPPVQLSVVR